MENTETSGASNLKFSRGLQSQTSWSVNHELSISFLVSSSAVGRVFVRQAGHLPSAVPLKHQISWQLLEFLLLGLLVSGALHR